MIHPLWTQLAAAAGRAITDQQAELLHGFLHLLAQANERVNLTRIVDPDAAQVQHVADALTLLPFLPPDAHDLVDIGSGGGVPGLVLAIVRPDARVTLVESTGKKAQFLHQTVNQLHLPNVTVVNQRAEAAARGPLRSAFDVATARAIGSMSDVCRWCLPFLRPGGVLLAMKGAKGAEELKKLPSTMKFWIADKPQCIPTPIPGGEAHQIIKIIRKGA